MTSRDERDALVKLLREVRDNVDVYHKLTTIDAAIAALTAHPSEKSTSYFVQGDYHISINVDGSTHTRTADEWLSLARVDLKAKAAPSNPPAPSAILEKLSLLKSAHVCGDGHYSTTVQRCIEELEAAIRAEQPSAGEPVAWRWRGRVSKAQDWNNWDAGPDHPPYPVSENYQIEPLYAHPAHSNPVADRGEEIAEAKAEKDEAYRQRNYLVATLARMFPSGVRNTDIPGWSDDWHGCCFIDLPSGQISYHFHDSHRHLFDGLPAYETPWDDHDKETVHARLLALSTPAESSPELVVVPRDAAIKALYWARACSDKSLEAALIAASQGAQKGEL